MIAIFADGSEHNCMAYTAGEHWKPHVSMDNKAKQECFWEGKGVSDDYKYGARHVHRGKQNWLQLWCFDTSKQVHSRDRRTESVCFLFKLFLNVFPDRSKIV